MSSDVEPPRIQKGDKIGNQWIVKDKLGEGSCGVVWLVSSVKNPKAHAAMKVEPFMKSKDDEILKMEAYVLKKMQKSPHFCRIFLAGKLSNFNYIIMSLLGRNFADLRQAMPPKRFTTTTSLRIALQGLEALRDLHTVGFLHRDVKPANFALGTTQSTRRTIFIFDFGLARQILMPVEGSDELKLREPRKKVVFRGTVRYCSSNVHNYKEQGRQDDIISLLYMVVEFITGDLPWQGLTRKESGALKESIPDKKLFHHCPKNFSSVYTYLKQLNYQTAPNYELLREKFSVPLQNKKITPESPYDWEKGGRYYDEMYGVNKPKRKKKKERDEKVEKDQERSSEEEKAETIQATDIADQKVTASESEETNEADLEREDTLDNLADL